MKKQIRVIGIDDASFDKFKDERVLVLGIIYRGGDFMDGLVSCHVKKDGDEATDRIISTINKTKFKPQLQYILLDGIAVAGFNVINVKKLSDKTGLPVIVVIRDYPDFKKIVLALKKLKMDKKIKLIKNAGKVEKIGNIYAQLVNIEKEEALELFKILCTNSFVPEPIRVAHIIGSGIVKGESHGRA
jgi:uncharacterized protein